MSKYVKGAVLLVFAALLAVVWREMRPLGLELSMGFALLSCVLGLAGILALLGD